MLAHAPTHRHLPSPHPTRALCGASIAWSNITTRPELATCPTCLGTPRRRRAFATAGALAFATVLSSCALATRAQIETVDRPTTRPSADVVAFCGPNPAAPHWRTQLATLASIGVTAVHGPCLTPPADYAVLEPGARYASQADYLALAEEARRIGLGVIVHDPVFWTDPDEARAVWGQFIDDGTVVAVDLGDEPSFDDMPELNRRAGIVRRSGAEPQVVFIGGRYQNIIAQHRALPTACPTSDDYEQNSAAMSDASALHLEAGCSGIAIDTTGRDLDGDGDRWSTSQLVRAQAAGFRITLFTGVRPDNYPTWDALVDDLGQLTDAGRAVKAALR